MKWTRTGKTVRGNGESTITYDSDTGLVIESRKRAIPHAGCRPGSWMHTSYFLIRPDGTEKEYYSLGDAMEAAEREGE